jgi:hypothetical protein
MGVGVGVGVGEAGSVGVGVGSTFAGADPVGLALPHATNVNPRMTASGTGLGRRIARQSIRLPGHSARSGVDR